MATLLAGCGSGDDQAVEKMPLGVSLLDGELRSYEFVTDSPSRPPAFGPLAADAEGVVYSLGTLKKYLPSGETATLPETLRAQSLDVPFGPTRYVTLAPDGSFVASAAGFTLDVNFINTSVPTGGSISRVTPAGASQVLAAWGASNRTPARTAPGSVAADHEGNIYFLDYFEGGALRKLAPDGIVSTFLPGTGSSLYIFDFTQPALAVSPSGELHIVYRNRIGKLDAQGRLTLLAGTDGIGDVVDGTGSQAQFYRAGYPAFDAAGNLYVADGNTVRKVTPAGAVTTIAGSPNAKENTTGPLPASFRPIRGLAVAPNGVIYVSADRALLRIRLQ